MTNGEFIEATSRLEKYYDKEYTVDQLKIMFDQLKDMDIERYRKTINKCIRTSKFLPKIADILTTSSDVIVINTENEIKEDCKRCRGTGWFFYKQVSDGYEYSMACKCICQNVKNTKTYIPNCMELGLI